MAKYPALTHHTHVLWGTEHYLVSCFQALILT